ncbi:MAG: hypothetical protein GTO03_08215 [Planctomycetales bacterium]|nr:hypothetical protein [Planctomycetales bacterium]
MSRPRTLVLAATTAAAACVAGGLGGWMAAAQPGDQPADTDQRMQRKLVSAQNILAGLATENFEAIAKNARLLDELGKQRWVQQETPAYRAQHLVFWFANDELIRLAEEKNIDGATLCYVQMTISCVNCHKVLRQE